MIFQIIIIFGISKVNIYKTAIEYAKEKNFTEIVELLSNGPKQAKNDQIAQKLKEENAMLKTKLREKNSLILNEIQKSKEENAALLEEVKQLKKENKQFEKENKQLQKENKQFEKENKQFEKENKQLQIENKQITEKNKIYENFLSSLKEKPKELTFFDLKEYEEEPIIGNGATSNVKIVCKKEKYAKKELVLFDHKSMQRFLGECEILFKLRHPCIIRVYGFNYGDKTHKPSMILSLEPKSLETAIKNKELTIEEKNRITVELVLGMRYIHKHKFMHRDLKPLNILLSKNNHVRITDFGLAKEEDFETSQTKGVGTLLFMAPELFVDENEEEEKNYTNKVDVYSFGITLIFIVTDKYPPKSVITGVLPKLSKNISKWIHELIINCLSRNPENRPSFTQIFEIMKENNFDIFSDSKNQELTSKQFSMKQRIESRILKIEAFEYQHQ